MSGTVYSGSTSGTSYGDEGNIYGGAMSSSSGAATTGRPPQIGRNSITGPGYNDVDFSIAAEYCRSGRLSTCSSRCRPSTCSTTRSSPAYRAASLSMPALPDRALAARQWEAPRKQLFPWFDPAGLHLTLHRHRPEHLRCSELHGRRTVWPAPAAVHREAVLLTHNRMAHNAPHEPKRPRQMPGSFPCCQS